MSPLLRSCVYIACFFSAVRAFNVTVGTPTQCDDLAVSWTGGQAPFEIILIPVYETLHNISVPESAFSNGKGSYSIPQIPLKSGTQFLLTMSDATGFGSGGTTTVLTVGAPIANNNCNTTVVSPDFTFELPSSLEQCNGYNFSSYDRAIQPITITALIPGGEFVTLSPPNASTSYNWVADVKEGTDLIFFMMDSQGRTGGISDIEQVSLSSDTSCLGVNSPSSTASSPSQTSSQSTPSSTSSSTSSAGVIAGATVGGVAFLGLMIVLGICCKRKMSRSSESAIIFPLKPPKDHDYEAEVDGGIPQNSPLQYQAVSHVLLPIQPGSQSQPANAHTIDPFTQHLRQISYSSSFAGSPYPSTRMTTIGEQTASPNTFPHQAHPAGLAPPIHPGSHSYLTNASTGNFAVGDPHAPFSQNAPSSPISPANRQMATMAEQTAPPNYLFPYQTRPVSHPAPPIQSRALSYHASAVSGPPTPLHRTRSSHLSSTADAILGSGNVRSSSMSSPGGRMAAAAVGQTATNLPAQIIVHTDIEDIQTTQDALGVVELPPQYADRQPPALPVQPAPGRRHKSSRR